jgi:hypothetical protein
VRVREEEYKTEESINNKHAGTLQTEALHSLYITSPTRVAMKTTKNRTSIQYCTVKRNSAHSFDGKLLFLKRTLSISTSGFVLNQLQLDP